MHGTTPVLRLAADEIRLGSKLDAAARRCGFAGANYLCRLFRRQYGLTPLQFRRQQWLLA